MNAYLLDVSGEDHHLRIPFMLALRQRGLRVSGAGTGNPAPFAQAGIDYFPFPFDRFVNPWADWIALNAVSKLLVEVRPDLAQSYDTKPNLLVPMAAREVPGVLAVRIINGRGWIYSSGSPRALVLRPIYRALHRLAARSTAATVFEIRDDQAYFEHHRMAGKNGGLVIPGHIDIERFRQALAAGPSPARLRDELGLGTSEIIITVTRMTRQKGIPTLLEAAALVHAVRPGARFLLVGPRESEGPFAVTQAEIERHAPYVMAVGPRSDVPSLLALADLFAFPTEYREGVPRVLLEAALAQLPIVTTSMPGCRDVVSDGYNGFVIPPREPRTLAVKILHLLNDRRTARAMGSRAAELVKREFDLGIIADRYAALYSDLLDRTVRGRSQATRTGESVVSAAGYPRSWK